MRTTGNYAILGAIQWYRIGLHTSPRDDAHRFYLVNNITLRVFDIEIGASL